ncbi:MAG TPA: PadR family transcriptional regulator [Syntrophomonadaceae bacterium]|nr:PadR family transcriptional regulator [Syntrophomonadaceae bacterium]
MSLQQAILGLLSYESMSGYDMKSFLDTSINFFWTAQLSQIYRDLGTLEKKGLVSYQIEVQEGRPDRKVYSITEKGEKAFEDWLGRFPQTLSPATRDEFCMRIFFGSRLPRDEVAFQLKRFIKEKQEEISTQAYVKKVIATYSSHIEKPEEVFYWNLLLRRNQMLTETLIQWAQESIRQLELLEEDEKARQMGSREEVLEVPQ